MDSGFTRAHRDFGGTGPHRPGSFKIPGENLGILLFVICRSLFTVLFYFSRFSFKHNLPECYPIIFK